MNSLKEYNKNKSKFKARPKMPGYCKSKETTFIITNQDAVIYPIIKDNKVVGHELKLPKTKHRLNLGKLEISKNFKEVQVKPFYNNYKVLLIFDDAEKEYLDTNRFLSIDLGIDNFLTTSNNCGLVPLIINGKEIKSVNRYTNKLVAKLTSELPKDVFTSKALKNVYKYRNNYLNDKMHKISNYIIKYCLENNISNIVIGKNDNWKNKCNLGNNTQKFMYIPYNLFIEKMDYKCKKNGIKLILQEESYTSKASALDEDFIPVYEENKKYEFSGTRINRGLYKSKDGILINADVNGATNILRKTGINLPKDLNYLIKTVEKINI